MHSALVEYETPPVAGYGSGDHASELAESRTRVVEAPATRRTYIASSTMTTAEVSRAGLRITFNAEEFTAANRAWRRHICNLSAPASVDALTETVQSTVDFIGKFGPQLLDLSNLNPEKVHCEHLAALLRATSSLKKRVPGWSHALEVAKVAVNNAGQDIDDVLFGMSK